MKTLYSFLILLFALLIVSGVQGQTKLIDENIQSWTARGSYGTYTQNITAGTVNMTDCIVQPSASASNPGTVGRVQIKKTSGILKLPSVSSVSKVEFNIVAGGANRSIKLQYYNGTSWTDLTTFSNIGTTCATYTHTINSSTSTEIRLAYASDAIYVHDIIVYDYVTSSSTISVNPATLLGFSYIYGSGPSDAQTFTVSGSDLTANISLSAPTNYEISTSSGSGYGNSLTLTQSGGSVASTTIYVRLKAGLSIGNYNNENINITSTGASSKTVTCNGSVTCATLGTPVATAGTNVGANQFTANWNAVSGASGYYLDVYAISSGSLASDLFISEYVEGSGNNKYIEIFNGTGSSVNLSNYRLQLFSNGVVSPSENIQLTGTLPNNSVIVYKNSSASAYSGTATNNAAVNFSGDDAVALYKISPSSYVDIFGRIGEDPGSQWQSGSHSTLDKTLVRKSNVTQGVTTNPSSGFPTLTTEWNVYNQDDVSHLGSHTFAGGGGGGSTYYILQNYNVGNTTSYVVTGLDESTTYYYVVRAYDICSQTSSNSNEISVTTVYSPSSYGTASIINNNGDALQNSDIWQRDKENQKIQISIYGGNIHTINKVSVEIPSDFTNISSGNISLSGAGNITGTSVSLLSNTIEVTGAGINNSKPLIISISGIKTPEITNISSTGVYDITVKTKFTSESELTAITNQPKIYITIPIENVKEHNITTGALIKKDLIVAVEGVSTIESGRLATSSYDHFFIQEGEGVNANGLAIHKSTGKFTPALEISKHFVVKGAIKLVRGENNSKTNVKANMTAISNPLAIVDMGEDVLPLPYITTIEQLYSMSEADFEKVDGVLMRIINVRKQSGTWPSNNSTYTNLQMKDNGGTNTLRCYIFANTGIGGNPEPAWPVNMVTLVYNYDENDNDIGESSSDRQITPVYYDNFYNKIVWRGSTGNKLWSDTRNWSPMILPQEIDQVVFDNITGPNEDYEVLIDARTVPYVKGVEIKPSGGKKINVILPNTNNNDPALRLAANGSGLVIDNNGTFTNNSKGNSGTSVQFNPSGGIYPDFKIKNGGRYIHKTQRASSDFTDRLVSGSETTTGTFEFDIPGANQNYPISVSGKTFGNLELSASMPNKIYVISGNSAVTIKNNFIINENASIREYVSSVSNFQSEYIIGGNLIFNGISWSINTNNTSNQIRFNGSGNQSITANATFINSGDGLEKDIVVDNTSGVSLNSDIVLDGNLNLSQGNIKINSSSLTLKQTISYGTGVIEGGNNAKLYLKGNSPDNLKFNATNSLHTLDVNKTSGDITMLTNLNIVNLLNLQNGIINTEANTLGFGNSASVSNASASSFVNGFMSRTGASTFTFPSGKVVTRDIGDGDEEYSIFAPITLSPSANITCNVNYVFSEPPYDWWPHDNNMDVNLKWISSREYWNVSTTGDVSQVKLAWTENGHNNGETCIHDICPQGIVNSFSFSNLTVVAYHNNKWRDLGVSSHTGNHDNGSITSANGLPSGAKSGSYVVTLGSYKKDVTLPVELINFTAQSFDKKVELFWETASEQNNEGFIVEHAAADYLFHEIGFVAGNGNSSFTNSYNLLHNNPTKGINYYRLKQIDFDGKFNYSNVITINLSESLNNESISYFIDETQTLHIDTYLKESNYLNLHIYDSHGRLVYEESRANQGDYFKYHINLNGLKAGMYYFILSNEESFISNKFIITE